MNVKHTKLYLKRTTTKKTNNVTGVSREGIELEKERLTGCEKKER